MSLHPVILSGGFGGRLWPVSRENYPKQFISLIGEHTLLQETILRLQGLPNLGHPSLVCNSRHRFIAAEQLRAIQVEPHHIFLEPIGRNTAPALAVVAHDLLATDPNALMLVAPSDHIILNVPSFHHAIQKGRQYAEQNELVTFGVLPTSPKVGYGYIQKGPAFNEQEIAYQVQRFVEKPNYTTAEAYLQSRQYLWNSGIFLFKVKTFLDELKQWAPDIFEQSRIALQQAREDIDFVWLDETAFAACPENSIDYAVMEHTKKAVVLPVDMGWSDVGSWGALWEIAGKDTHGNVTNGRIFMKDVSNCYIQSNKDIVATLGVQDLIIIDTEDALLIAHRHQEQEVKNVFKRLM